MPLIPLPRGQSSRNAPGQPKSADQAKRDAYAAQAQAISRAQQAKIAGQRRNSIWSLTPAQRSQFLATKGYNVAISTKGNRGIASAGYAYEHGISPKQYNSLNDQQHEDLWNQFVKEHPPARVSSHASAPSTPPPASGSSLAPAGGPMAGTRTDPSSGGGSSGASPLDSILQQENLLHLPRYQQTPESAANVGSMENPDTMAQMAGQSFAAAIDQLNKDKSHSQAQTAQNIADIGNWYKQVISAVGVAAGHDHEITQAGIQSINDVTKSLIGSLGGSANAASGSVADVGNANVGAMTAIGASQDQYNQDLQPILNLESAGAKSRQMALSTQAQAEFASKMADLLSQQGTAQNDARTKAGEYHTQLAQQRLGNLLEIRRSNAAASQQDYNNKMGQLNARGALLVSGANADAKMTAAQALAAYRAGEMSISQYNAITARIRATKPSASSQSKPWTALSPGEQNARLNQLTQGLLDPTTGAPLKDANTYATTVRQRMAQYGINDTRAYQAAVATAKSNAPQGWWPYGG